MRNRSSFLVTAVLVGFCWIAPAAAKDQSILGPIMHVDKEKGFLLVSGDSGVVTVEASKAAKPHLTKLPRSGIVDIVVEIRPGKPPLLKTWKVARGQSSCQHFNGKSCN